MSGNNIEKIHLLFRYMKIEKAVNGNTLNDIQQHLVLKDLWKSMGRNDKTEI